MRSLFVSYFKNYYTFADLSVIFLNAITFSVLILMCFFLLDSKPDYNTKVSNELYFSSPRIWYSSQDLVDMMAAKFFGTVKSSGIPIKITVDPFNIDGRIRTENFFYSVPVLKTSEKLKGIAFSSNQEICYVVIFNQGNQFTYSKGELIQGTTDRIIHILPDRVIIDHQGTYRAIIFSEEK